MRELMLPRNQTWRFYRLNIMRLIAVAVLFVVVVAGCGSDTDVVSDSTVVTPTTPPTEPTAVESAVAPTPAPTDTNESIVSDTVEEFPNPNESIDVAVSIDVPANVDGPGPVDVVVTYVAFDVRLANQPVIEVTLDDGLRFADLPSECSESADGPITCAIAPALQAPAGVSPSLDYTLALQVDATAGEVSGTVYGTSQFNPLDAEPDPTNNTAEFTIVVGD